MSFGKDAVRDFLLHLDALLPEPLVEGKDRLQRVDSPGHLVRQLRARRGGASALEHKLVMLVGGARNS